VCVGVYDVECVCVSLSLYTWQPIFNSLSLIEIDPFGKSSNTYRDEQVSISTLI